MGIIERTEEKTHRVYDIGNNWPVHCEEVRILEVLSVTATDQHGGDYAVEKHIGPWRGEVLAW